jgi:uncharacterized protein (TIGR02453 family)
MAFTGWRAEAVEFFEQLEDENTKAFWQRNKTTYETLVRAPMEELLTELAPTFGEGKIFRPYRDVRFSADKSPYKTNIAAMIGDGYLHVDAEGLGVGAGMYEMAPDQLDRYRVAVDDARGKKLESITAKIRAEGADVTAHDTLKTAPKGYPKDHPRIELLRYKGLIAWRQWPAGAWLGTRRAKDRIVKMLEISKPLTKWLNTHVGPSTRSKER